MIPRIVNLLKIERKKIRKIYQKLFACRLLKIYPFDGFYKKTEYIIEFYSPKTRVTKPNGNCELKMVKIHGAAYKVGETSFESNHLYNSGRRSRIKRDNWYSCN